MKPELDRRAIAQNTRLFMMHNYEPLDSLLVRGEGVWGFDNEGRKILDMFGAYAVVSWGHANPRILSALITQACLGATFSRGVLAENSPRFAEMLLWISGFRGAGDRAHFAVSGRDAVEDAIKFARRWGYRQKGVKIPQIIACHGNFHGRGLAALSCSAEAKYRKDFGPFLEDFETVPFGNVGALERAITADTVAFLVEPIQGEGGVNVPPKGYLLDVQQICRRHNVLLVLDEIQTGLGRTGKNFCYQHDGVDPDMVIIGKALGGGDLPSYAVVGKRDVMTLIGPGDHGGTFEAYPLQCAVGIAVLKLLQEENLAMHAANMGDYLMAKLEGIESPLIKEVRGKGLLVGVEFVDGIEAKKIRAGLLEDGVLAGIAHNVLRFSPPLIIEKNEIDLAVAKLALLLENYHVYRKLK